MKLCIFYKCEGDGFQCNAVCNGGYTYSFYFRHGPPPNVREQYKHLDLSPTAQRVMWLASRLPNQWTRIYMDNLFNSQKLFTALHIDIAEVLALAHGVACTNRRGVPPSIIQKEEKNKDHAEKLRGTTLATKLHDSDACPDLFAVSIYNTKPVHILSIAAECVEWIVKEKEVWSNCRSPDSWPCTDHAQISLIHSPTPPKCSTRAILALINNLGIVYHQYCSSSWRRGCVLPAATGSRQRRGRAMSTTGATTNTSTGMFGVRIGQILVMGDGENHGATVTTMTTSRRADRIPPR